MIRAVLLDAHGTLLELPPPAPALRRLMAERFAIRITDAQAARAIAAEIGYYRAHLHEGRDDRTVHELRGRCSEVLRQALAAAPALTAISAGELTQTLLAALQFRAYPEVAGVLQDLRARGLRLVVASNWDASLARTLDALGLLGQLDGVVTSAQAGAPKPEPPVFERALALAGVRAGEALHVGDSLEEDIAGAARAGIRAVLVNRERRPVPPHVASVASLADLRALPDF